MNAILSGRPELCQRKRGSHDALRALEAALFFSPLLFPVLCYDMAMSNRPASEIQAAFIVREAEQSAPHTLTLSGAHELYQAIQEGDWVVLLNRADEVTQIASVLRIRLDIDLTTLYFKQEGRLAEPLPLDDSLVSPLPLQRLPWPDFIALLKGCKMGWYQPQSIPLIKDQIYLRELLQLAVSDDLLGPANGPYEEIIHADVRYRYTVGKLAPMSTGFDPLENDTLGDDASYDGDEESDDLDASTNLSFVPSSIGFTFCVDGDAKELTISAGWGRYIRTKSEVSSDESGKPYNCWKRAPAGGTHTIPLTSGPMRELQADPALPDIYLKGSVSKPKSGGVKLVTLFLVNQQPRPDTNQDAAWLFQPELKVWHAGGGAIFRRRPLIDPESFDNEQQALGMIYRQEVEFGVGHGIAVHATPAADDYERAVEVKTVVLPDYEVPQTEPPGNNAADRPLLRELTATESFDMSQLAAMSTVARRAELVARLSALIDDYGVWINEQQERVGTAPLSGYDEPARQAVSRCKTILARLREGIEVLARDDHALAAFGFANRAMAQQRIHTIYAAARRREAQTSLTEIDIPRNRSWRPFQLAFVLLSLPALADPAHKDRTDLAQAAADLLWFPTGGGKTEAYLGVAAFTMGIRRLQGVVEGLDGRRGLAVIMRYTLRLLTLQQFQRATTLICAMELIRSENPKLWGETPFTIGLWVGNRVTPGTTKESLKAINDLRDRQFAASSPAQLTSCPWCGSEIASGRDITVDPLQERTLIYCGDKYGRCEFSLAKAVNRGVPVVVVDEEIYRRPPSMLIATVDKFAMMAWRGAIRTLFGKAEQECPRHGLIWPEGECRGHHNRRGEAPATSPKAIRALRPPDLIIQDEFHLISGPLGTMVALYETAVDELSSWRYQGKKVHPKVVASTATVRKATDQTRGVFVRDVAIFPPHGLDVADNFFAVQRPISEKPGRRYLGVCAPGSSRPSTLIRVYVALLTGAQFLFEEFGELADTYMTLVGYFNSLRELGGMKRLSEDDVHTRSNRVASGENRRPGLSKRYINNVQELTSRISSRDIPKTLNLLETAFTTEGAGRQAAIDIVLATNMLSVGVDVSRIGLMVVNGQPKNTAEYIQATSRVGRASPGLVCTVFSWSRPRDLSHYETFEHYHATFYKHVEARSVTPFAPRALDRGLTGAMVSLMRHRDATLNPNGGAQALSTNSDPAAVEVQQVTTERAARVATQHISNLTRQMVADRLDRWIKEATRPGRLLGYESVRKRGDMAPLLKRSGLKPWDELTVSMSMREVEPPVPLIFEEDAARSSDEPPWRYGSRKQKEQPGS